MDKTQWHEVETKVKGRVIIRVSGRVGPRDGTMLYSARVGTAQLLGDGTVRVSAHMSIHDLGDVCELAQYAMNKYQKLQLAEAPRIGIATGYRKESS